MLVLIDVLPSCDQATALHPLKKVEGEKFS